MCYTHHTRVLFKLWVFVPCVWQYGTASHWATSQCCIHKKLPSLAVGFAYLIALLCDWIVKQTFQHQILLVIIDHSFLIIAKTIVCRLNYLSCHACTLITLLRKLAFLWEFLLAKLLACKKQIHKLKSVHEDAFKLMSECDIH